MMNGVDFYMKLAIKTALQSDKDLPVGCVITDIDGNILACTHNKKEVLNDVTAHAEILAIREVSKKTGNWRISNCNLYVTLEPCPMCAWAILNSRIKNVYFGAYDKLYGAFGGKINLEKLLANDIGIRGGIMEEECENLLKNYFKEIRK